MSIAEESGKYTTFQSIYSNIIQSNIFLLLKNLKNIEPILLLLIAILVGMIMLAMYYRYLI